VYYLHTLFDYSKGKPIPWATSVYNTESKDHKFFVLYMPGTGLNLLKVEKRARAIAKLLISGEKISVNDFKAHIDALDIQPTLKANVYSRPVLDLSVPILSGSAEEKQKNAKSKCLQAIVEAKKAGPELWQKIEARAHIAYSMIEKRGVWDGVYLRHPYITTHTVSGRANSTEPNIFGFPKDEIVEPLNKTHSCFLHFDWIAADIRAAAVLSGDQEMQDAFNDSDPYNYMADQLNKDREECKIIILKSLYSLDWDQPYLSLYPKFKKWISASAQSMRTKGYTTSILGRKFYLANSTKATQAEKERSVFNAGLQGTIAHAMQRTMGRLMEHFPDHVLFDRYDSVILTCDRASVMPIVDEVSKIMFRPFEGVLKSNPTFPLEVSVGPKWHKWKSFKVIR
jgi:hypothetical protein